MKKLSLYIFLILMVCNVGFADNLKELFNKDKIYDPNKEKFKFIDPSDPSFKEGITYEELQKQIRIRERKIRIKERKQAEFRCAFLSGKSNNDWSARKVYKTCLAKEGY